MQQLVDLSRGQLELRVACEVPARDRLFPVCVLSLGNPDPQLPAVGFFGGVHGLERIGAEVVLAYVRSLVMRLSWDSSLQEQLRRLRLLFMPVVNPGGVWLGTRANPRGVDLMRNAPIDAVEPVPFLVGGQRYSAGLPWYRGRSDRMEAESLALCTLVEDELLQRPFALTVDCHSGFGTQDRLWFPYAHTRRPIPHLPEFEALRAIFEQAHVHHPYVFEPQSAQYLTHGDLWDYLYQRVAHQASRVFLPLTLEMGSWLWVKKNPRQLFSRVGIFNPLIKHRQQRVMRRHLGLLDFFMRAAGSYRQWLPAGELREAHQRQALARWYGQRLP